MLSFKNLWFQLHWFIGITAGTVLIVIGLSGAAYAFQDEILDFINPGTAAVPVRNQPALALPQLVEALRAQGEGRTIQRITVSAEPGAAVPVTLFPAAGERRGPPLMLDPYTGARLPERRGAEFFDWALRLHRWLLLPRDDGKQITGTLAAGLLVLSLSGLYLRWPRRPLSLRNWFTFDTRLQGRSFLWGLHSVIGTWALVAYVVFSLTGLYWAFDAVRGPVDRLAGVPPRSAAPATPAADRTAAGQIPSPGAAAGDIAPVWTAFAARAAGWQSVQFRLPERASQAVQVFWRDAAAPHENARHRMNLLADGTVRLDERFGDLPAGRRALAAIYPLHLGSYFGLPGRIFMALASLAMPLFAITGWMLYLDRRRKARAVRRERAALAAEGVTGTAQDGVPQGAGEDTVLVAFASQAGRAERLAVRTVAALRAAGLPATLAPVAQLDAEGLRHHRRVLFIASTFGEGEPPDAARRFARALGTAAGAALPGLHYGLLALGDRQYAAFCGFGHALDHQLRRLGAQPLFPLIELDGEDAGAWAAWQSALAGHLGAPALAATLAGGAPGPAAAAVPFTPWTLAARQHCNAGSQGAPLFWLQLTPPPGSAALAAAAWQPGALVEVLPQQAAATVDALLQRHGHAGDEPVRWNGQALALRDALARSIAPLLGSVPDGAPAQALADALQPLAPRSYSVASLPREGHVGLLVRQVRHDAGLGLASGWLTAHAPLGTPVALRLVENMAFAPAPGHAPAVFIGNGSGYAGLRGHLLARIQAGQHRNWLLFGERQQAHDAFCTREAARWLAAGQLERADFVYSRDQAERRYVQDALREQGDLLRAWVAEGATLYVCGSLAGMAAGVDAALAELLGADALDDLIAEGRYRRDVY